MPCLPSHNALKSLTRSQYTSFLLYILRPPPCQVLWLQQREELSRRGGLNTQLEKDFWGQRSSLQTPSNLLKVEKGMQLRAPKSRLSSVLVNVSAVVTTYLRTTKRRPVLAPTSSLSGTMPKEHSHGQRPQWGEAGHPTVIRKQRVTPSDLPLTSLTS